MYDYNAYEQVVSYYKSKNLNIELQERLEDVGIEIKRNKIWGYIG